MIRDVTEKDASHITRIYNYYILHSHSTFEIESIEVDEMSGRIQKVISDFQLPWLVKEENGRVWGYAYATKWKAREAYNRTVETSVYLDQEAMGKGIGTELYKRLLDKLQSDGYHSLLAGISMPNDSSIKLHEKLGFQKVGQLKEVGHKFNRWIDVGYWELIV